MHSPSSPMPLGAAMLLALLALCPRALAGDVLTVGPGGTYAQIQDAIDAAADGDIVLVASGAYGAVVIVDKAVTVLADRNALVEVDGVRVEQLAAQRSVALIGLASLINFSPQPELVLCGNAGSVRLEGCSFQKYGGVNLVTVDQCADVSFRDCEIAYVQPAAFSIAGHTALTVTASKVSYSGGLMRGGNGPAPEGEWPPPPPGGAAIRVVDSQVFVSGTSIEGGPGGAAYCDPIYSFLDKPPGNGGPAVQLSGTATLFRHRAATIVGGAGGDGGSCMADGIAGVAFDDPLGTSIPLAGLARPLDAPRAPREVESIAITLHGVQGEAAYVLASSGFAQEWFPSTKAVLLVEPPFILKFVGFVGASNALSVVTAFPELGPGIDGLVLAVQPLFLNAQGVLALGELHTPVPLDRSF